jgi:hypothetical protein
MKEIDEGGQSLLDNSILLCCSNLYDGDAHSADQMPMLLAGKGGGTLRPGRILDYLDKGDDNRRACSLYLTIMDKMGVQLDRFGDTDKRLVYLYAFLSASGYLSDPVPGNIPHGRDLGELVRSAADPAPGEL